MPRMLSARSGQFGVARSVWGAGALVARRLLVFLLANAVGYFVPRGVVFGVST